MDSYTISRVGTTRGSFQTTLRYVRVEPRTSVYDTLSKSKSELLNREPCRRDERESREKDAGRRRRRGSATRRCLPPVRYGRGRLHTTLVFTRVGSRSSSPRDSSLSLSTFNASPTVVGRRARALGVHQGGQRLARHLRILSSGYVSLDTLAGKPNRRGLWKKKNSRETSRGPFANTYKNELDLERCCRHALSRAP